MRITISSTIYDKYHNQDLDAVDRALQRYALNPLDRLTEAVIKEGILRYGNKKEVTAYRGLNFATQEDYEKFLILNQRFLTTKQPSSWSFSKKEAEVFAKTRPSYMEFMTKENIALLDKQEKEGEGITGYRGVILATTVKPNQGLNLTRTKFSAEEEIILPPGRYELFVENVLSFKDTLHTKSASEHILEMKSYAEN